MTLLLVVVILLTGCSYNRNTDLEAYKYTFRLAEAHPDDYPTTLADYEFARLVKEKTDGRINILVYPNKQLGEEKEVIEQVQFGAIDFTRVSIGPLTEFVPELNVLQLPYLYEDDHHMWRVLISDIGDEFLDKVSEAGFIGLAWYEAGARSFYNNVRPIKSVKDLKGLKIRVMESALMLDIVHALGAKAQAMPYGEVYSALQTNVIDGAENNYPSYDTSSHYEVARYYSIDEHVRVPEILIASKQALKQLSDEDWLIIKEAAKETQDYQRELWKEKQLASEKKLLEEGIIVNVIEDKSDFYEAVVPLYKKYGEGYESVIEKIRLKKNKP